MPGRAVYLWTLTVKLWPPLEHRKHHQHINTINSLICCVITISEKYRRPINARMENHRKHHNKQTKEKKEKPKKTKSHTVLAAKAANKCMLTCFRTKSESLNNADPWKLMLNWGASYFPLRNTQRNGEEERGRMGKWL